MKFSFVAVDAVAMGSIPLVEVHPHASAKNTSVNITLISTVESSYHTRRNFDNRYGKSG